MNNMNTVKEFAIVLLLFGFFAIDSFAQQGEYVRKSVSSIESVWIKPGAVDFGVSFDHDFFEIMVDEYIEMNRFDYNTLPEPILKDFRDRANSLSDVTPEAMSEVLNETVVKEILNILNDPEVKKARGQALKSESDAESFAATKAKSLNLTTEQLKTLLNSAYIYLPYIGNVEREDKDGNVKIDIEGGIIWYNVVVSPDGTTELELVKNTETSVFGMQDLSEDDDFAYGTQVFDTNPVEYAFYDATLAFAKNLGVQTKEIEDFKLSAQVTEVTNNKYYFPLGKKEGIYMDDTFLLYEQVQDESGEVSEKQVGLVRVINTANNREDENAKSEAVQLIGDRYQPGIIVRENPRYGLDIRVGASVLTGIDYTDGTLKEPADGAAGGKLTFSYNTAPIIGITQTFVEIQTSFNGLNASTIEDANNTPLLYTAYLNARKRFSFGRAFVGAGLGAGVDGIAFFSSDDDNVTDGISTIGVKADAETGFLISPNLSLNVGLGYKVSEASVNADFGGLLINVGVSYSLRQLPFNVFGFLDGLKKH